MSTRQPSSDTQGCGTLGHNLEFHLRNTSGFNPLEGQVMSSVNPRLHKNAVKCPETTHTRHPWKALCAFSRLRPRHSHTNKLHRSPRVHSRRVIISRKLVTCPATNGARHMSCRTVSIYSLEAKQKNVCTPNIPKNPPRQGKVIMNLKFEV